MFLLDLVTFKCTAQLVLTGVQISNVLIYIQPILNLIFKPQIDQINCL